LLKNLEETLGLATTPFLSFLRRVKLLPSWVLNSKTVIATALELSTSVLNF